MVRVLGEATRRRRRRRQFAATVGLLSAAAAVGGVWLSFERSSDAAPFIMSVQTGGAQIQSADGLTVAATGVSQPLRDARQITTDAEGSATIEAPIDSPHAGLKLGLGAQSELVLPEPLDAKQGQLRLVQGEMTITAPAQSGQTELALFTPGTRLIAYSSEYRVALRSVAAGRSLTCVEVARGSVLVERPGERNTTVRAGERWGCDGHKTAHRDSASQDAASLASEATELTVAPNQRSQRNQTRKTRPSQPTSTLAEENQLLADALKALRLGKPSRAETLLNRLLRKYPDSPLSGDARETLERAKRARSAK